jgi:hypothetical protein
MLDWSERHTGPVCYQIEHAGRLTRNHGGLGNRHKQLRNLAADTRRPQTIIGFNEFVGFGGPREQPTRSIIRGFA